MFSTRIRRKKQCVVTRAKFIGEIETLAWSKERKVILQGVRQKLHLLSVQNGPWKVLYTVTRTTTDKNTLIF